jgi:transitional endoplasmic reticulum ATPase
VQVSIPDLLAEENPVALLNSILQANKTMIVQPSQMPLLSENAPDVSFMQTPNSKSTINQQLKIASSSQKEKRLKAKNENLHDGKSRRKLVFLLLDEVDALGHARNQNEIQIVIKAMLCEWLDQLAFSLEATETSYCLVATSNRAEDIDMLFRRGGRLEHEINVLNSQDDRTRLMKSFLINLLNEKNIFELIHNQETVVDSIAEFLGEKTGGYVAADLAALVREVSLQRIWEVIEWRNLGDDDLRKKLIHWFTCTMASVPPSCLRGVTIQLPKLSFQDVIGCSEAKFQLSKALSFTSPAMKQKLAKFGMYQSLGGVLLYGPPGNSKTRLITAAAAVHNLPLISLSSADIYSAYVGDAEAEIRKAFTVARQAAPCILFFDEMDSLVTNRAQNSSGSGAASVEARVLSTFLNEMDGVNTNAGQAGVIVIGATNRIDCIDAALIRKGRFYQTILIPPPNQHDRRKLLEYFLSKSNLSTSLTDSLEGLLYDGISGAQIENIVKEEVMRSHITINITD